MPINHRLLSTGILQTNTLFNEGASWSNFFDGTGDYLVVPGGSWANLGANNFTVECWFFASVTNAAYAGILTRSAAEPGRWDFCLNSGGTRAEFWINKWGISGPICGSTTTVTDGQWHHLAAVRNGNVFTFYVDGVAGSITNTWTGSVDNSTNDAWIGTDILSVSRALNGRISNLRLINGTALYTSNFTPATQPLTAIANTSLLTCQSPSLKDESTNNFAITINGDVRVDPLNPFSGQRARFANTEVYGSLNEMPRDGVWSNYFDGNEDYLSGTASSAFDLGTGDFTVEAWVNFTNSSLDGLNRRYAAILCTNPVGLGAETFLFSMSGNSTSTGTGFGVGNASGGVSFSTTIPQNTWVHLAVTRSSGSVRGFLDGTQIGNAQTYTTALGSSTNLPNIGSNRVSSASFRYNFNGYISNLRLIKGTAVYTTNFTPPTQPLTAIANTSLLTCQSPTFRDNSTNNFTVTRNGNAIESTFSPYAESYSNFFDGTGDFLSLTTSANLNISTGDFTIEFYVNPSSVTTGVVFGLTDGAFINQAVQVTVAVFFSGSTLVFRIYANSTFYTVASPAVTENQWAHYALVRSGNVFTVYANGVSVGTTTQAVTLHYSGTWQWGIGSLVGDTQSGLVTGYISNFRVVKGTAVYTTNFTPPTQPLTAIANTSLLTCQSNRFIDNSANNFTITRNGDVAVSDVTPFQKTVRMSVANTAVISVSNYFDEISTL